MSGIARRGSPRRATYVAAMLGSCLLASISQPVLAQSAGAYLLGPQDRIRLKIFEWRPSRDEMYSWTALNDEFTIAADGTLSIPFAGEIPAAGRRPQDIGRVIGVKLREHMGLAVEPDTSVEVVQYRPFYIDGYVDKPGEYPFRPGLTAAMALAIAGGAPRMTGTESYRLEREAISGRSDIALLNQDREVLAMRLARLQAEADDQLKMASPPDLATRPEPSIKLLIARETSIFEARLAAFNAQIAAINDLKRFLVMQVDTMERQVTTIDTQMKLMDAELKGIAPLVEKGLTTAPRQLALERAIAQIEGDKLRVNTELLRTRESISRADISILELRNKRRTDATVEINETQGKMRQTKERIATAERLLLETEVSAPRFLSERADARRAPPTVRILRNGDQGVTETVAATNALILPGDTIRVEAPRSYDVQPPTPSLTGTPLASAAGDVAPAAN